MNKKLYLLLVLAVAFVIRFQNFDKVFSSTIFPAGYDPYYHLRLAEVIVKAGYRPNFDYYLNYPYGLKISWLPLFDYMLALPGVFFGFKATEIFAMIFPVILGVISTFVMYMISKKLLNNEYFALLSSLIFAVTPAVVQPSVLGFCDYHIWNLFLLLCSIYFMLRDDLFSLLSGVFITLLAFSWIGAPIYVSMIALAALISFEDKKILITAACTGMAAVSFVLKPFLGLSFIIIALFLVVGYFVKKFENKVKNVVLYYIALCLIVITVIYFMPIKELWFVKAGVNYLMGWNIYLPTIKEAQPFNFYGIVSVIGIFVFFLILPALLLYRNSFVLTLFVSALFLAMLQIRFTTVLAVPASIYTSYTLCTILDKMGYSVFNNNKIEKTKNESARTRKKRRKKDNRKALRSKVKNEETSLGHKIYIAGFIGFILLPSFIAAIRPFSMNENWKDALIWIRDHTEKTSYYLHPDKKPEYSILSWWDYGNWIVYIAKRPVVCNNFQVGAIDAAKFFTAQNESVALKIVRKRGVRYIITAKEMQLGNETTRGKFQTMMLIAGIDPYKLGYNKTLEFYKDSMFYKLHIENASTLKHFKLLKDFGAVKIFTVK